ncbi:hypothetical protein A3A09_03145 [Candidatus Nomurabacteria bacterium RIFCSPLOWO2_01_FULL_42_20]|uniref:Uncharacterized protein n=1 Tax=Candidatus Nomurabacteria bacterium RIFCSPHIGHO2_01_FULL_42_16 TaxID=1801743 RepID=A0A1F6VJB2_9BACT|nr:MAG: hypothetical protein A2824_03245 [Candidatus Nomurabacteria bacterium RIFCSPHIGHO2_01_FULL_42_16]OGI92601.1 MAG: hypothetical protein A3A09_03145 [Candidatus Nomurabacteria bacterium RIFCSPLOWO2_01_FULL_42_20]
MIKVKIFKIDHKYFEKGRQEIEAWLKKNKDLKLNDVKIIQSTKSGAMFDAETIISIFYKNKK